MKSAGFLQQLEMQMEQLAHAVEPYANNYATQARFDHQLFHCHTTRLGDYLPEVRQTLAQLKQCVQGDCAERVAWTAERVVLQMGALQRELVTQTLRSSEAHRTPTRINLYEKLAEHQDFERRLRAMIADRESLLVVQKTLVLQQQLQREIAALEGRLQRCLQEIKRIERAIENRERDL